MRRQNSPHRAAVSLHDQALRGFKLYGHGSAHDSGYLTTNPQNLALNRVCFQEIKRKNGVLTLQGVGVFQGLMGALNIDDVKCIRDALVKVYLPIIMADPELNAQYNTAVRSLQRINERIDRESERAAEDQNRLAALQAVLGGGGDPFGFGLGDFNGIFRAAAALLQQQQQQPQP